MYKAALNGLYWSQLYKFAPSHIRGRGLIFTLHQVGPKRNNPFDPNSILKITPEFLEATIKLVKEQGYDIIKMDDLPARLADESNKTPFILFTMDDGYRDNRDVALPIFEKYNVPILIYIVSDFSSKTGQLWWLVLEEIIRKNSQVKNHLAGDEVLTWCTPAEQHKIFYKLYWHLRRMDQWKQRSAISRLAEENGVDISAITTTNIMNWQELRALKDHPLVTLGAHSKSHFAISCLPEKQIIEDITAGIERHQAELGQKPAHFAYPYGDAGSAGSREFALVKELGFETAVTTRKGLVYSSHKNHLTALPRISLNGDYQSLKYVNTYLSGWPFFIFNGCKQLNVQ